MKTMENPTQASAPTGYHELPKRAFYLTIAGIMLAMLLAALDQTIVGTAMPTVVGELGGFDHYTWVVTAYLIASTITVPIVGKLSDLHGRKPYYLIGTVGFLVGSVLCGAAQDMTQLILFRGFQGLGAGIMQATAFTVIGDLFPPARRGRAQGIFGSVFGVASIIGPTAGGYITDHLSWRWVFYVNLPLGLLALAVLVVFFPAIKPNRPHRGIDYVGAATMTAFVVPLLLALTWGGTTYPWFSVEIIGFLTFSLIMLAIFIWNETRAPEPILPLNLFRNRIVTVSVLAIFLTAIGMFGSILFVPLFIQGVIGASATTSGNVLTPMMLSFVTGSIISGQLITRTGHYKIFGVLGTILMTIGMGLLASMTVETSYFTAIAFMVTLGIGLGATMPVFTLAVQNAVPYAELGVATSAAQFFRSIGGSIGAAVMGSILTARFAATFPSNLSSTVGPEQLRQLPPQVLQIFERPQVLFAQEGQSGAGAFSEVFNQFGAVGQQIAEALLQAVRLSLADAIRETFLISAVIVALSIVLALLLREIPLRQVNRLEPKSEPAGRAVAQAENPRQPRQIDDVTTPNGRISVNGHQPEAVGQEARPRDLGEREG